MIPIKLAKVNAIIHPCCTTMVIVLSKIHNVLLMIKPIISALNALKAISSTQIKSVTKNKNAGFMQPMEKHAKNVSLATNSTKTP